MANSYNSGTHAKVQTLMTAISTALGGAGNSAEFHFDQSAGFKLEIEVLPDGRTVRVRTMATSRGPNNSFVTASAQAPAKTTSGPARRNALTIDATSLP